MPFKIIETIEKGHKTLCIVPSLWELKGVLRWPKKRIDVKKLIKDENSMPSHNWSTSKCSVKRLSLSTYEEAIRELDFMVQNSDTEIDIATESTYSIKNNINFNTLADSLVINQSEKPTTSSSRTTSTPILLETTTASEYVVQYVDDSELATISVDTHHNEYETQTPVQTQEKDFNQMIYLKQILENQTNLLQTMNVLAENQNKIFHKLASLSIQMEDGFANCKKNKNTDVVMLGESNPIDREAFMIKPIDSVNELEDMELLLSDESHKCKLLKQYSFVCSKSEGNGGTCAYKMLDIFFSRDFLCKCSWTGGSRSTDQVKIGLKKYKNVLKFYLELIRLWDKTYTAQSNEDFFKIVLKNSLKRKLSKNERASTKRRRTKKNKHQTNNTPENSLPGPSGIYRSGANKKLINNKEMNEQVSEEEEEEESLC